VVAGGSRSLTVLSDTLGGDGGGRQRPTPGRGRAGQRCGRPVPVAGRAGAGDGVRGRYGCGCERGAARRGAARERTKSTQVREGPEGPVACPWPFAAARNPAWRTPARSGPIVRPSCPPGAGTMRKHRCPGSPARSRALPAPDLPAPQRGGRRLSSSTHHGETPHRLANRVIRPTLLDRRPPTALPRHPPCPASPRCRHGRGPTALPRHAPPRRNSTSARFQAPRSERGKSG
jgi:hypothetical protein